MTVDHGRTNRADVAVILAKGGIGAIPFVGPLVAEVVGALIPNQRIDRIERFAQALADQVRDLDRVLMERRAKEPGFVDLFEDGLHQSARALSDERIRYIASLVVHGLCAEEARSLQFKHLLGILHELDDNEVILLASHAVRFQHDEAFWELHANVLAPARAFIGAPREELDKASIQKSYESHLRRLHLVEDIYETSQSGQPQRFDDKTGMPKVRGRRLAPLGRLLLRTIGVLGEEDF